MTQQMKYVIRVRERKKCRVNRFETAKMSERGRWKKVLLRTIFLPVPFRAINRFNTFQLFRLKCLRYKLLRISLYLFY